MVIAKFQLLVINDSASKTSLMFMFIALLSTSLQAGNNELPCFAIIDSSCFPVIVGVFHFPAS